MASKNNRGSSGGGGGASGSTAGPAATKARTGSRRSGIKTLSIAEKLMVIERAEAGESPQELQQEYGIKKSTYYGFLKDKEKIRAFAMGQGGGGYSQRKYVSKGKYLDLEKVVLNWYRQQRALGMDVEGVELQRLAESVAKNLGLTAFSASTGWLFRFRTRHGILNRNYFWNPTPDISFDEIPKDGLTGGDDRGSSEYSQNEEETTVTASPEQFLAEANEREPTPAPVAQTPPKPESYQLRHNNHLTIVLEALARDEAFMDVTLTAQGRSLKAHKSVLSAVSPYFRSVLRDNPCQHPIIIMPRDVRFEELFSIVNYIYKGEMTVAAEDLTSLLKTAEILQVSGLAPSDSTATVNPHTANIRSSSASSSSSSNLPSIPKAAKTVKETNQGISTPVARPKSPDGMINPSDFMDMDMTYVKEEVHSGGEEDEDTVTSETSAQPPENTSPKTNEMPQPEPITFSSMYNPNQEQTPTSNSSPQDYDSSVKSESETDAISNVDSTKSNTENPQPFICPYCQDQYRGVENMTTHLRLNHPTKPGFTCGCGRVFIRHMTHQAHVKVCSSS